MGIVEITAILLTILLNASAQIFLRLGVQDLNVGGMLAEREFVSLAVSVANLPVIAGLGCYVFSVMTWIYVLSRLPVSTAYPMMSLAYVVGALLGYYILGEPLSYMKLSGVGVICVGVWIVAAAT